MRFATILFALAFSPAVLPASTPGAPITASADSLLSETFSVDTKTIAPGRDLNPGDYKIAIIEHLSDRLVLQITNKDGKVVSTFLGIIGTSPSSGIALGPIRWTGKGPPALRGFSFPGAAPVEFVYPKNQAVTIAKGNVDKVLAIDPASDNLSASQGSLSTQDMQIVTLWSLKATRVGPDAAPAIEAARYQVPAQPSTPAPSTPAPVYVARSTPPPAPASSPTTVSPKVSVEPKAGSPAPRAVPQVQSQASTPVVRKRSIAVLPHTGSNLPLLLLSAVVALLGLAVLRVRRIYGS